MAVLQLVTLDPWKREASAARSVGLSWLELVAPPIDDGIQPMMAAVPARQNRMMAMAAMIIIG